MTQADIQQAVESIWALFRETDRRIARITAETQREIAALSKQIRATEGRFTGQWGRLMEALVRPGVVHLFQGLGDSGQPYQIQNGCGHAGTGRRWSSICCW